MVSSLFKRLLLVTILLIVGSVVFTTPPLQAQSTSPQVLNYLYVGTVGDEEHPGTITVINNATRTVVETITLDGTSVYQTALTPDGTTLYAPYSKGIAVIDTATNSLREIIRTTGQHYSIIVDEAGDTAYTIHGQGLAVELAVFDLQHQSIVAAIPLGPTADELIFAPDGKLIYVSVGNEVVVIDLATNIEARRIQIGRSTNGLAISADGTRLYVVNRIENTITVVDLATDSVLTIIPVGQSPWKIAIPPAGGRAYVTNFDSNNVSVVDLGTNGVVQTIAAGNRPVGITFAEDSSRFYVANLGDDTLSVISTSGSTITTITTAFHPYAINYLTTDADVITVTSTNEPGTGGCNANECTLREAMALAAVAPLDVTTTIAFNIPGDGPHSIALNGGFSINRFLVIDGFTQPGSQPNTNPMTEPINAVMKIEISGGGFGFNYPNGVVRGLVLNRGAGLTFYRRGGSVQGCFLGTDVTGTEALGGSGISLGFVGGVGVGGGTPADRNLISGNGTAVSATYGVASVGGNFIGTDVTGTKALGNGTAIVAGSFPQGEPRRISIGGNLISGNNSAIVLGDGFGSVGNNLIGTDRTGTQPLPNGSAGITMNTYGNVATNNVIAYNNGPGIVVNSSELILSQSYIRDNLIKHNEGNGIVINGSRSFVDIRRNQLIDNAGLGIDLANNGVTRNDPRDGDTGPNHLQNTPLLQRVGTDIGATQLYGTLNSTPNKTFAIELFSNEFCDPSGYGEGERFIQAVEVVTDNDGNASFVVPLEQTIPLGHALSATATGRFLDFRSGLPHDFTSEFAPCRLVAGKINALLTLANVTTVYDPTPVDNAPAGVFTLVATFENQTDTTLSDLFFQVATASNNNLLLNAAGGPAGVGAMRIVDAEVAPGARFDVDFVLGLQSHHSFDFLVDAYGLSDGISAGLAEVINAPGFDYAVQATELQSTDLPNSVYLPMIAK